MPAEGRVACGMARTAAARPPRRCRRRPRSGSVPQRGDRHQPVAAAARRSRRRARRGPTGPLAGHAAARPGSPSTLYWSSTGSGSPRPPVVQRAPDGAVEGVGQAHRVHRFHPIGPTRPRLAPCSAAARRRGASADAASGRSPATSATFAPASCTRFSPNAVSPRSSSAATSAAGTVLVTASSVDLAPGRGRRRRTPRRSARRTAASRLGELSPRRSGDAVR